MLAFIRSYSLALITGVVLALVFANVQGALYHDIVHWGPLDALCSQESAFCMELHHEAPHGDAHHGDDHHGEAPHGDAHHADEAHGDDHEAAHPPAGPPGEVHRGPTMSAAYGFALFHHHVTLHFLINDLFMVLFFGVAAKEIVQSILPGGALNPPSKAINPILATLGGVFGPVLCYLLLVTVFMQNGMIAVEGITAPLASLGQAFVPGIEYDAAASVYRGWGVPTATDIALAWLIARIVFGATHPAVNFLLLLAIADDAIGLLIIAIFYPNPAHPVAPVWLLLVLAGMAAAYAMRRAGLRSWVPYVVVGGALSWTGLINASLHPALALVPIVPFLPGPGGPGDQDMHDGHSPLEDFEHSIKNFVDDGLIFFGFANAGVAFASMSHVTTAIALALLVGKTLGIAAFAWAGNAVGFKYPGGMQLRHVVVTGIVAGTGLTVALFVAGEAFPGGSIHQGPAKMGALFSASAAIFAVAVGRMLHVRDIAES